MLINFYDIFDFKPKYIKNLERKKGAKLTVDDFNNMNNDLLLKLNASYFKKFPNLNVTP